MAIPISFLGKLAGIIDGNCDGYILLRLRLRLRLIFILILILILILRVVASDSLRKFASISLLITLIHTDCDFYFYS